MLENIFIPVIVLGLVALVLGIGLSFASKFFGVKVDKRILEAKEALPGINCGACGYSGCDSFSEAVVNGEAPVNGCPVGGDDTAKQLAKIMGIDDCNFEPMVARVDCNGTTKNCEHKQDYYGIETCSAAQMLYGGVSKCNYGCIGLGDCVRACPFDAITIIDSLAVIIESKCTGCTKCVAACPKSIIEMVPQNRHYTVSCSNKEKAAVAMKQCKVACIGCGKCVKACPVDTISMDSFLAKIEYSACINCGKCEEVCPTKAINIYPVI